jgi:inhibitor of KinA sporulation pathway (predicted exonuclease)
MFEKMCQLYGVKYPFSPQHLNIKAMSMAILGKRMGVGKAITKLGLQFEGTQHRGVDDAVNAARILQYLTAQIRGDNDKKGWITKSK